MTNVADVPGLKLGDRIDRLNRPGYEIHLPGECLKPGGKKWSDAQRERGIWIRMVFLTASEEEDVIIEASRTSMAIAGQIQVRKAIVGVADNVPVEVEQEDGSKVTKDEPGPYAKVSAVDSRAFWEEIGVRGRGIAHFAFNQANAASEEAREAAAQSFRLSG